MISRGDAFAAAAGVALCTMTVLVLAGWLLDVSALRSLLPGAVAMNPLTALCFGALGVALVLAARAPRTVGPAVIALALVVGGVTLVRMLTYAGWPDLGIDTLVFADALAAYVPPSRMTPSTALAMFACALAIPLVLLRADRAVLAGQLAALGAGTAGLVALSGYALGLDDMTELGAFIPMALPTGLAFVALAAGTLALRTDAAIVRMAVSPTAGGQLLRRTAPAAVLLPPVLVWLAVRGVDAGLFSSLIAISIAVIAGILLLVALLAANAHRLDRAESVRAAADVRTHDLMRELQRKSAELAVANTELEAFSYSVSHDLRAPLRSISGFSQILIEDYAGSMDAEARSHLDRIVRAGNRMARLIDDLLELSRVTRGALERADVDVSAIAIDIAEELALAEPARDVDVVVTPGMRALADARLVRVVVTNLMQNAWKYTARTPAPHIEVGVERGETDVFFVRDNGAGFDMRYADRLFTPFQRLHADAEFEGSGIGLATVRRIVHRHGGHVSAESAPDAGATFRFSLNPESIA